jgi:[acyl-carrier-protein] S-malonyltransferase
VTDRRVVLLLPGQGSQYAGMGVPIYEREPAFATVLDEFFDQGGPEGKRLRDDWLGINPSRSIDDGVNAQPLLFALGYAIGRVLEQRGVQVHAMIGHSVGELAAAALAGVFDPQAAARLLFARAESLLDAPAGGMVAVAASPERVSALITPAWAAAGVVVGAVNSPMRTVLAGPEPELTQVEAALRAAGLSSLRVPSLQPFHSPVLEPAAARFEQAVAAEELHPPERTIISGLTGRPVEPSQACSPAFWARQLTAPVRFWDAVTSLPEDGEFCWVEAGPGNVLCASARRHASVRAGRGEVFALLPPEGGKEETWSVWADGLTRVTA